MTTIEAPAIHRFYAGIDPSLTGTGICILVEGEDPFLHTIVTSPKTHPVIFERLNHIANRISGLLFSTYNFGSDDAICIERPFVSPKNMNAQQNLLVLSYLIRQQLYEHKMAWKDVSPMALKKFVCGKGKAEKSMMLMRVYQNWDISADDDNQADAAGLAYMAKAIDAVRGDAEKRDVWPKYQIEVAKKALEGK